MKVLICYNCLPGASGERFCVVTNISTTWCQRNAGKYQQSTSLESKGCKPAGKGRQKITLVCPSPAPTVACAQSNDISTIWYWCWLNSTATWKLTWSIGTVNYLLYVVSLGASMASTTHKHLLVPFTARIFNKTSPKQKCPAVLMHRGNSRNFD